MANRVGAVIAIDAEHALLPLLEQGARKN